MALFFHYVIYGSNLIHTLQNIYYIEYNYRISIQIILQLGYIRTNS